METNNEHISALELQVESKDTEIVAKVSQVESLEGKPRIEEEWTRIMSVTFREHVPQFRGMRRLVPVLILLYVQLNLNFKSFVRLSYQCRRWVNYCWIRPVLRCSVG